MREDDELLTSLTDAIRKDEEQYTVVNSEREKDMQSVYNIMNDIVVGTDVEVVYESSDFIRSIGGVRVTGKNLSVTNLELFVKAARLASIVEFYPKTDGTAGIDFTFHGLTRKAGE